MILHPFLSVPLTISGKPMTVVRLPTVLQVRDFTQRKIKANWNVFPLYSLLEELNSTEYFYCIPIRSSGFPQQRFVSNEIASPIFLSQHFSPYWKLNGNKEQPPAKFIAIKPFINGEVQKCSKIYLLINKNLHAIASQETVYLPVTPCNLIQIYILYLTAPCARTYVIDQDKLFLLLYINNMKGKTL